MDCIKCESDDVIVDDLDITGVTADGELEVSKVTYRCLDCDNVWSR